MPRLILGHTTDKSIKIWVRGEERWSVAFVDVVDSKKKPVGTTKVVELESEEYWTDVVTWNGLKPDTEYRVKVAFGKEKTDSKYERIRDAYTEGKFKTFPMQTSNSEFTFLLGSCNLHSLGLIKNPDKPWARISEVAGNKAAKFMIHCGDQIYADIPLPPCPDPDFYRKKYIDAWDDCRTARAFLTQTSQYMILDDHEITNDYDNDMDKKLWLEPEAVRNSAMKVYWEFQHKHNPDTDEPGQARRYWYTFNHGAAQFFVMDTRFRRASKNGKMIDDLQLAEFKKWLKKYANKTKFIVTSIPFVGEVKSPGDDKWCSSCFAEQRNDIYQFIAEQKIEKTVFLTGDMHNSYHASAKVTYGDKSATVHELMSSPINQFTPDMDVDERYHPSRTHHISDTFKISSKITRGSYFGDHSNVMAITVKNNRLAYQIYRTSKPGRARISKSFSL